MNQDPPPALGSVFSNPQLLASAAVLLPHKYLTKDYYPFRTLKHIARQYGHDPIDAWAATAVHREAQWQVLPLRQEHGGGQFKWCATQFVHEPLHRIDRAVGGGGPASLDPDSGILGSEEHRRRLRIRTLMDEAAESSLIEGAATTRREAVEMLRAGREPRTIAERMVANNYAAMERIKTLLSSPLSPELLLELQETLTRDTLEDPSWVGRWRGRDDRVRVVDVRTNEPIFTPPDAGRLHQRIRALCDFANTRHTGEQFIHPIVKASVLHFMLGYEHPFMDGNGRTARAVFYWYALREGYTLFEFIPISERIRAGAARYPQAYVDCELDDGDLTYFILYKLDIIEQSLDLFNKRLRDEEEKVRSSEQLLQLSKGLNLRQRMLLQHALRRPRTLYTRVSHAISNGIAVNTAATDLEKLVRLRLLTKSKRGKETVYTVVPGLHDRLQAKTRR